MEMDRYVDQLRTQMLAAAEPGGDDVRSIAERLVSALEASARLVLLEALSDAASEITVDLAPGSVEVRLRGRDPEIVVTPPPPEAAPLHTAVDDVMLTPPTADTDEGGVARLTVRMPESLKVRVEDAASREALSVNSWLVRAVTSAVDHRRASATQPPGGSSVGSRFTGWAR